MSLQELLLEELRERLVAACEEERIITLIFNDGGWFPARIQKVNKVTVDAFFLDEDEETWVSSGRVSLLDLSQVNEETAYRKRRSLAGKNPELADQVGDEPLPDFATRAGATTVILGIDDLDLDDFDDFDDDDED